MRRVTLLAALIISVLPLFSHAFVDAASGQQELVISQFKVTSQNGQFFMLYNAGDKPVDMGSVQLVYYNDYVLSEASSSKVIGLSGKLEPGGYYLVNDGPFTLCYQMLINSVSLNFSTTGGTVMVQSLRQAEQGQAITATQHDFVSWSKSAKQGVQQLPEDNQSLLRRPVDADQNPAITTAGAGEWLAVSPSMDNPCQLETYVVEDEPQVIETSILLLPSTPPPVTILGRLQEVPEGPYMPAGNIGLMAPVVNELLANPGSPQTDADDEFIELYNPNDKPFELTGFQLQVGLNTKRTFTFPAGTMLAPKSFTAFYSSETNLALSNSGSVAELVDPFGNVISKSDAYSGMKDDIAWALAHNEWLMTTTATPGEQNIISGDTSGGAGSSSSVSDRSRVSGGSGGNSGSDTLGTTDTEQKVADIHPSTLAGMAGLALGYGAYEYRTDAANKLRQFRANRSARRKAGS